MQHKQRGIVNLFIVGAVFLVLVIAGGSGYFLSNQRKPADLSETKQVENKDNNQPGQQTLTEKDEKKTEIVSVEANKENPPIKETTPEKEISSSEKNTEQASSPNFTCPNELLVTNNSITVITNKKSRQISGAEQNWINSNCPDTKGTDAYRMKQIASFACPEEIQTRQGASTVIINNGVIREASAGEQDWVMKNCREVTQGVNGHGWMYNQPVVSKLPSCVGNELLSVSPMNPNEVKRLHPLGFITTPRHVFPMEHMEYCIPQDEHDNTIRTTLYAPGALHIIGIRESFSKKNGVQVTDNPYFSISFANCKEVYFYFEGMSGISDALRQAAEKVKGTAIVEGDYDTNPNGSKMVQYRVDYVTTPGEVIGFVGGPNTKGGALEWGGRDTRIPKLGFLGTPVPDSRVFYTICPVDYFPEPLKSQLYSKFTRADAPRCGTNMQDLAGTIQGNWLGQGYPGNIGDTFLGITHHYTTPTVGIIAVSGYLHSHGMFYYNPQHTGLINREPSEVKADGQTYCYQKDDQVEGVNQNVSAVLPGRVILQLQDNLSMKVEWQDKACDGNYSFVNPIIYKR